MRGLLLLGVVGAVLFGLLLLTDKVVPERQAENTVLAKLSPTVPPIAPYSRGAPPFRHWPFNNHYKRGLLNLRSKDPLGAISSLFPRRKRKWTIQGKSTSNGLEYYLPRECTARLPFLPQRSDSIVPVPNCRLSDEKTAG